MLEFGYLRYNKTLNSVIYRTRKNIVKLIVFPLISPNSYNGTII